MLTLLLAAALVAAIILLTTQTLRLHHDRQDRQADTRRYAGLLAASSPNTLTTARAITTEVLTRTPAGR